jgi:hypothetical protein
MSKVAGMSDERLSELEVKILAALRKRDFATVAREFRIPQTELHRIVDNATAKRDRLANLVEEGSVEADLQVPMLRLFRLEKKIDEPQIGTMKVGSQILDILSKGIYSAPENAVKELLSNAFDANAYNVTITSDPKADRFTVWDDGDGMDYVDFDNNFTFISRSSKREEGLFTRAPLRRPIIGKIGIGFVAVSELCGKMKVKSAKRGSDTFLEATIDFEKYRLKESKKKEFYEVSQFELVNHEKKDPDEHYTEIELRELKPQFLNILLNKMPDDSAPKKMLHGGTIEEVVKEIRREKIKNIMKESGPYWRFLLNLCMIVPVGYIETGPLKLQSRKVAVLRLIDAIKEDVRKLDFTVTFNDLELKKPVLLPSDDSMKFEEKDFDIFAISHEKIFDDGSRLKLRGYVYNQRKQILPEDWRGLITRIKNTAIGLTDPGFWDHPYPGDKLYLPQTFGEIYVGEGLEDAMNIDRSSFKTSHEHYQEVRLFLNEILRKTVFDRAKDRWKDRRAESARRLIDSREALRTTLAREALGTSAKVVLSRKSSEHPIEVVEKSKQIIVYIQHPLLHRLDRQTRETIIDVLLSFEVAAMRAGDDEAKLRLLFLRNLDRVTESLSDSSMKR